MARARTYNQIGVVSFNSITYSDATVLPNTAYAYRLRAFNGTGVSAYSNEATVITPATSSVLAIGTSDLPDATVGVAYGRTLAAFGGDPDFSWLLDSGSLPPGLSLNQSGSITGTPSTAGTFNFVVKVTDVKSNLATKALTLIVKPAAPLTIVTTQLPRASVGSTYSQNLGASGGQTPYYMVVTIGQSPGWSDSQSKRRDFRHTRASRNDELRVEAHRCRQRERNNDAINNR